MTRASDRVMVVTAHPDDPEFGAGGTVAKLVKEGREVTYVIVTNGNKGSLQGRRGPTATALRRPRDGEGPCLRRGVRPCRAAGLKMAS